VSYERRCRPRPSQRTKRTHAGERKTEESTTREWVEKDPSARLQRRLGLDKHVRIKGGSDGQGSQERTRRGKENEFVGGPSRSPVGDMGRSRVQLQTRGGCQTPRSQPEGEGNISQQRRLVKKRKTIFSKSSTHLKKENSIRRESFGRTGRGSRRRPTV